MGMDKFGFSASQEELYEQLLKEQGLQLNAESVKVQQTGLTRGALSFGQQRIWFLQQIEPESPSYHVSLLVRIQGAIDAEVLTRSFNEILHRHPILRTVFRETEGGLEQVVLLPITFTSQESPLTDAFLPGKEAFMQFICQEVGKHFDLESGPLWRLQLFSLAEDDHILLFVCHHLIIDGWSVGLLLKELLTLYDAFRQGRPSPLAELPFQYLDYANWQRSPVQEAILQRELAYWKKQLEGAPPVLELPTDHPRPKIQTSRGSFIRFSVPQDVLSSLKKLAEQHQITMFMLMLGVFEVLLYRYANQEEILVGTPVAGRERVEWEGIMGLFINTVVLRTNVSGELHFNDLLAQIRQVALDAFAHQSLPFEKLVEALHPERNLSYSPLFQVMFVMQNAPLPAVERPDLRITPLTIDSGFAQYDLSVTVWEEDGLFTGTFEFNTDLFERVTIEWMVAHYQTLLQSAVNHPNAKIADLQMLTPAEQGQLLMEWNATGAPFQDSAISRIFEFQAANTPDALAVIFGEQSLTYAQLNRHANQLASYLQTQGVTFETPVGIYLESSIELIVAVLGILKAGGAYIPLDPVYPRERLLTMLHDAQAGMVITIEETAKFLPGIGRRMICLDRDWPIIAAHPEDNLKLEAATTNLACIIYTSGSTGLPKGVMLEHRGIANLIASFIDSYQPRADDRILPLTSLGSASFVGEIFPLICAGGALVLIDKANFLDFDRLLALVTKNEVTIMSTVPAVMARLNSETVKTTKLRLLLSGGEALSWNDIDKLVQSATVVNGYGLTETSICSTFIKLSEASLAAGETITIGRPVINHQVYILDQYLNCQPVGVPGEIYIGGLGLARGYLNRPELTAERFIPNPFAVDSEKGSKNNLQLKLGEDSQPGQFQTSHFKLHTSIMYRTGDRGVWLPDGDIRYLGRMDKQIKIRGYRIELAEIEACLGKHPTVGDIFLTVLNDRRNEKRLVAYVVTKEGQVVNPGELREWLREKLPEYMAPSAFEFLNSLPLNLNGKVDPERLPDPQEFHSESGSGFTPPRTPTEQQIAVIWMEVLNLPQVGVADNFFDLGGHSLLLTQVHRKLKSLTSKELTIIDLFKYPDIRSLAAYIDQDQPPAGMTEKYKLVRERALLQKNALQQLKPSNRMKR